MKKGVLSGIQVAALLMLTTGTSFAGWFPDHGMAGGTHMMGGGYMGWTMILFWVILLFVIVSLIRWMLGLAADSGDRKPGTPLDILKTRLARGEIDIEEFEKKRQLL